LTINLRTSTENPGKIVNHISSVFPGPHQSTSAKIQRKKPEKQPAISSAAASEKTPSSNTIKTFKNSRLRDPNRGDNNSGDPQRLASDTHRSSDDRRWQLASRQQSTDDVDFVVERKAVVKKNGGRTPTEEEGWP
jgi:hypothetical protein